jgi:hypothetical protein
MRSAVIGTVLVLLAVVATAQVVPPPPSCSLGDISAAAAQVQAGRKALLALPIGDDRQTDVSPEAQQKISNIKENLGALADAYMLCAPPTADTQVIQRELSELVKAFKLPDGPMTKDEVPPDLGKYGFQLWFDVRLTQHPKLISVTAVFDIECGSDTVLFVFEPEGGSWREVLRWQSKPYETISDAFWSFDHAISPPDSEGRWYVVTKHISPWCSSTWSGIDYDVLRTTVDSSQPKVLLSRSDFMWWGNEDYGKIVAGRDEFDVRFHSASIDVGVHNRVFIRHYSITGDNVKRIQPVAVSPRDFVDEWIISKWEEASRWSAKASLEPLRQAHEMMSQHEKAGGTTGSTLLEFRSAYRCSNGQHQVEVSVETGPKFQTERSVYFLVAGEGRYTMTRVSDSPNSGCGGQDLLDSMETRD